MLHFVQVVHVFPYGSLSFLFELIPFTRCAQQHIFFIFDTSFYYKLQQILQRRADLRPVQAERKHVVPADGKVAQRKARTLVERLLRQRANLSERGEPFWNIGAQRARRCPLLVGVSGQKTVQTQAAPANVSRFWRRRKLGVVIFNQCEHGLLCGVVATQPV